VGRAAASAGRGRAIARSLKSIAVSPYLLLALAALFWASNWIIGRGLATAIPPVAMGFFRWLIAALILAPFAWPHLRHEWSIVRANRKVLLGLGMIGVGIHSSLSYLGLNYTTATNSVILNSFCPVMIIVLSWQFLDDRLSARQLVGVVVSFVGVLTILSQASFGRLLAFRLNVGDLLVIAAMAMWSLYTIGLRWRPAGLHLLTFLFVIACVGTTFVLPLYLAELAFGRHMAVTPTNVAALVSIALFPSVLAHIFWARGVQQVGANVAGLFVHLVPVFGVALSLVFLGEELALYHAAGAALILTGIAITSRSARRPALSPRPGGRP
jgi:drug/metabolite transporter (DMT)-like permease